MCPRTLLVAEVHLADILAGSRAGLHACGGPWSATMTGFSTERERRLDENGGIACWEVDKSLSCSR